MSKGPKNSRVNSREVLSVAICDIKSLLSLFESLAPFSLNDYTLFFDDVVLSLLKKDQNFSFGFVLNSIRRFYAAYILGGTNKVVLPALASFLLQLPSLLEIHYQNADDLLGKYGIKKRLSILGPQEAGIVFLSQVLPLYHHPLFLSYPDAYACSKSIVPLCPFEAYSLGSIEDHPPMLFKYILQTSTLEVVHFIGVSCQFLKQKDSPGIVTGNWGCGAFWGDPELKAVIQWLAASQHFKTSDLGLQGSTS
ncbi:hypothetical protein Patl1_27107 [Pistacia atlantica]|uniref:Uncharacterized protein n=1 Tax=Pistacia atlantica TaxID=434234 RepID=A0ACC1B273_9ROSI|nr:hypothetical protein Patl1_27107 [Pistacia atlantica]